MQCFISFLHTCPSLKKYSTIFSTLGRSHHKFSLTMTLIIMSFVTTHPSKHSHWICNRTCGSMGPWQTRLLLIQQKLIPVNKFQYFLQHNKHIQSQQINHGVNPHKKQILRYHYWIRIINAQDHSHKLQL